MFGSQEFFNVYALVKTRKSKVFSANPKDTVILVVKEFYANIEKTKGSVVKVRGQRVYFDNKIINWFYQLLDIKDDNYSLVNKVTIDLDEVINYLTNKKGNES